MTESVPTGDVTVARAPGRRHRLLLWGLLVLGITVVGASAKFLLAPQPVVPEVDLSQISEPVAKRLRDVRERVEQQPHSASAWGEYAMYLMQHDRPSEALICFRRAAELDATDARWHYFQGVILVQKDLDAAVTAFDQALRVQPDSVPCKLRLVSARLTLGDFETARVLLLKLRESSPRVAEVWEQGARLERLAGTPEAALKWLEQARSTGVVSPELLRETARVQLQLGHSDEARALSEEAGRLPPVAPVNDPWLEQLKVLDVSGAVAATTADQQRSDGRLDLATNTLSTLARRFPERSRPALNLALALRDQGRTAEAIQQLRSLVEKFPADALVHFHLAITLAQAGSVSEAMPEIDRCLELKPDYGMARAMRADLLDAGGDSATAQAEYERAIVDSPGEVWIRFGYLQLLVRRELWKDAAVQLQEAAKILPPDQVDANSEFQRLQQILREHDLSSVQNPAPEPKSM